MLDIHIPAAVLRNQSRRNSLPSAATVRRLVEETAMLQQSVFLKNSFLKKSLSPVWDKSGRKYVRYDVSKVHTVFHCGHWLCAPWGENFVLLRTFGAGRSHCNDINTQGNTTVPDFSLSRRGEVKR